MAGPRFSGLSRFLGGASKVVLAGDEPREISAAELETLTNEAHAEGEAVGRAAASGGAPDAQALTDATAAGFKAATDRFAAVMGSDAGKANPGAALGFLADEDLSHLSAEKLIAHVGRAGPAAAAPSAKPEKGAETDAARRLQAETPNVDLTGSQRGGRGSNQGTADKSEKDEAFALADAAAAGFNATSGFNLMSFSASSATN